MPSSSAADGRFLSDRTDTEVRHVLVATDQSTGGDRATAWAAALATAQGARLTLVQVVDSSGNEIDVQRLEAELRARAEGLGAQSRVIVSTDIAGAIIDASAEERADVLVVGNAGMRGRKEFLLGNVANRITHSAPCTTVIVQSTDEPAMSVAEPRQMDPRRLGRAVEILRVFARSDLRRALSDPEGGANAHAHAKALRGALEELGPTFCKLGQILSTRPDLVPPEYIDEFGALQSSVPPMTEAEVVSVMQQELLVPWEDVFDHIDPTPLAAGTIGQVHRARLADGTRVVVKVQRPNAAEVIHRDLALLSSVARGAGISRRLAGVIDLPGLVAELSATLAVELDFRKEAEHLDRMTEVLSSYRRLGVPQCHREFSTERLLVMDEVQGVPVDQAPPGPDRELAARELLAACFHQVMAAGFFHGDPHPGNLMWSDGRIWLLDLGMVGEVDEQTRRQLLLLLLAFWQGDAAFLADLTLALAPDADLGSVDIEGFEASLSELIGSTRGASLADLEIGPLFQRITELSVRHHIPIPSSLAMVGKALAQVQSTVVTLAPDVDLFEEARRFFTRDLIRRLTGATDAASLLYEAEKLRYRVTAISDVIATATGARPGRRLEIGFASERLERTLKRTARTVAVGLVGGGALIAAGIAAASRSSRR